MGCAPSSLDNTVHHSKYVASRPTQQKYGHYDRYKKQSKKFYKHNDISPKSKTSMCIKLKQKKHSNNNSPTNKKKISKRLSNEPLYIDTSLEDTIKNNNENQYIVKQKLLLENLQEELNDTTISYVKTIINQAKKEQITRDKIKKLRLDNFKLSNRIIELKHPYLKQVS